MDASQVRRPMNPLADRARAVDAMRRAAIEARRHSGMHHFPTGGPDSSQGEVECQNGVPVPGGSAVPSPPLRFREQDEWLTFEVRKKVRAACGCSAPVEEFEVRREHVLAWLHSVFPVCQVEALQVPAPTGPDRPDMQHEE